jgi:hypothetical protein
MEKSPVRCFTLHRSDPNLYSLPTILTRIIKWQPWNVIGMIVLVYLVIKWESHIQSVLSVENVCHVEITSWRLNIVRAIRTRWMVHLNICHSGLWWCLSNHVLTNEQRERQTIGIYWVYLTKYRHPPLSGKHSWKCYPPGSSSTKVGLRHQLSFGWYNLDFAL